MIWQCDLNQMYTFRGIGKMAVVVVVNVSSSVMSLHFINKSYFRGCDPAISIIFIYMCLIAFKLVGFMSRCQPTSLLAQVTELCYLLG